MKCAVLGSGSRGTALAQTLAYNQHSVCMWAIDSEVVYQINHFHCNSKYFPEVTLSPNITCDSNIEQVLSDADLIVIAVPSMALEECLKRMKGYYSGQPIVLATKGRRKKSGGPLSSLIEEYLETEKIIVLSGGSHAEELILKIPTSVVLASRDVNLAHEVQLVFQTPFFKCGMSGDVEGVQLFAAYKNIVALICGVSDGLGYGINTKALLLVQGIREIQKIGECFSLGFSSFVSSAGIGDLFVTCASSFSRNWKAGTLLAQGFKKADLVSGKIPMVVEGFAMIESLVSLQQQFSLDLPICRCLLQIIEGETKVEDAFNTLLES